MSDRRPREQTESAGLTRVLMVEDDESLRRILSRHLRAQGYVVDEAPSAEEAAAAFDRGLRPNVVVLDLNLPGDTGWDLLRGPSYAAAGSPPVIVASATSVSPIRLAEFRCAGYLPKPFPLDTLVATIERLTNSSTRTEQP
jgi:DNA-binding response OmpR family regulator